MSAVPPSLLAPRAPQVNLIPPEVASRRAAGKTRGMIFLVLFGFALVLGAASYAIDLQKRSAESALKDVEARGALLQTQIDKYADVPIIQAELANATSAQLFAGATEVRWLDMIRGMSRVMPEGVTFGTLSFANTSVAGVNAPLAGPFATAGIGLLAYTGVSLQYPDVASLERAINSVRGLTDAQIPAVTRVVTEGRVSYTFSGTATVTAQALDLRFTDAWLVDYNRELADTYLDAYVIVTEAQLTAAQAPGAAVTAADISAAQEEWGVAVGAREVFTSLSDALASAQADLDTAMIAQTKAEKGAEAAVAAAQGKVNFLAAGLDEFAVAVLASREAAFGEYSVTVRVKAAEDLVAAKQAKLALAQAALAAATTNRQVLQADVDYYTTIVSEAQGVLAKETAAVAPATAAWTSARDALGKATSAAQTVIDTADQAPPAEPKPAPKPTPKPPVTPTPGASPSPSTTKGSGG